jgi:hypothetical protein
LSQHAERNSAIEIQFAENVVQMSLDRLFADLQAESDLLVPKVAADAVHYLPFTIRQKAIRAREVKPGIRRMLRDPGGGPAAPPDLPRSDRLDRSDESLQIGTFLDDSTGSGAKRLFGGLFFCPCRQDEDPGSGRNSV